MRRACQRIRRTESFSSLCRGAGRSPLACACVGWSGPVGWDAASRRSGTARPRCAGCRDRSRKADRRPVAAPPRASRPVAGRDSSLASRRVVATRRLRRRRATVGDRSAEVRGPSRPAPSGATRGRCQLGLSPRRGERGAPGPWRGCRTAASSTSDGSHRARSRRTPGRSPSAEHRLSRVGPAVGLDVVEADLGEQRDGVAGDARQRLREPDPVGSGAASSTREARGHVRQGGEQVDGVDVVGRGARAAGPGTQARRHGGALRGGATPGRGPRLPRVGRSRRGAHGRPAARGRWRRRRSARCGRSATRRGRPGVIRSSPSCDRGRRPSGSSAKPPVCAKSRAIRPASKNQEEPASVRMCCPVCIRPG